jgi:hypothetical protein
MTTLIRVDSDQGKLLCVPGSVRLALFLLAIATANAALSDQIVGRWRSLGTSKDGIGAIYEFHANGDVDYSPGAVVEMTYRVEGDQLFLPTANAGGSEQKLKITWLGDNKVRLAPQSGSPGDSAGSELTRKGERADSKNPILGEWAGTRDMGGHKLDMLWFFYAEGKGLFLMPFTPQHGHYTVKDSTIRLELPNTNPIQTKFEISGNVLTMGNPSGNGQSRLARY